MSTPKPGSVGSSIKPSRNAKGVWNKPSPRLCPPSQISRLGTVAITWTEAATPTGPAALCGAIAMLWISAMPAIFFISSMPPQWRMSGCKIAHISRSMSSRNPQRVKCRSPVAMGTVVLRDRANNASLFSGWHGSSANSGRSGSNSLTRMAAIAGLKRRCKSTAMSMPSPTASRTAATRDTMKSMVLGVSTNRTGPGDAPILTARKPAATFRHAFSAHSSGVVPPMPVYTRMRSRTFPPNNFHTGMRTHLPNTSHIAISMPLSAPSKIGMLRL